MIPSLAWNVNIQTIAWFSSVKISGLEKPGSSKKQHKKCTGQSWDKGIELG